MHRNWDCAQELEIVHRNWRWCTGIGDGEQELGLCTRTGIVHRNWDCAQELGLRTGTGDGAQELGCCPGTGLAGGAQEFGGREGGAVGHCGGAEE